MPKPTTLFVGLDSHKDFISVAHAEAGRSDPPVFVGSIGSRQADIDKLVRRLHSTTAQLVFAYEDGPSRAIARGQKRTNCLFASSKW
jgi:transposase